MVGRILRALFYHYIKQRAKQTLKKPDNYLPTTFLQKGLTTEPPDTTIPTSSIDTSEKIIMEMTTEEIVADVRQWSIDRIHELTETKSSIKSPMDCYLNAVAIAEEFDEWIKEYEDPNQELDIMYLEKIKEVGGEEEFMH